MTNYCDALRNAVADECVHLIFIAKLREPESLRDRWFDETAALGLEPDSPHLPAKYLDSSWYQER